jgi:hypothetical protein
VRSRYKPDYVPQLEARYHNVSVLDPHHVSYSVEDTGKADTLKLYRNTSDLFGVDPYPWSNATLTPDLHAEVSLSLCPCLCPCPCSCPCLCLCLCLCLFLFFCLWVTRSVCLYRWKRSKA